MDKHYLIGKHNFFHISRKSFIYYRFPTFSLIWERDIRILFLNWLHWCIYTGYRNPNKESK